MENTEKKEEQKNVPEENNDIKKENITDKNEEVKTDKKEKKKEQKYKIGTLGNFLFAVLVVLILGTGSLTYYIIHSAKDDIDKQYNDIIANIPQNVVDNTTEEEKDPDTIANIIDTALSNVTSQSNTTTQDPTVGTDDVDSKKIMNEELIVLYNGLVLDVTKPDEVTLKYIDNKSEQKDKYVITYYSYENYAYKGSSLGTLSSQVYDGLVKIDNVGKVAISEDYEAIPREIKVVNTIPAILTENNPKIADYDSVKTMIVDLDGNQTDEYILILANKKTGFSKITLFDSKGMKIADLASIEKSKWDTATNAEYYLSLSNVEILDVDNDGIMEILVEIPHYEGNPTISLLKYKNGELQGKTGIECSLMP